MQPSVDQPGFRDPHALNSQQVFMKCAPSTCRVEGTEPLCVSTVLKSNRVQHITCCSTECALAVWEPGLSRYFHRRIKEVIYTYIHTHIYIRVSREERFSLWSLWTSFVSWKGKEGRNFSFFWLNCIHKKPGLSYYWSCFKVNKFYSPDVGKECYTCGKKKGKSRLVMWVMWV